MAPIDLTKPSLDEMHEMLRLILLQTSVGPAPTGTTAAFRITLRTRTNFPDCFFFRKSFSCGPKRGRDQIYDGGYETT